MTRLHQRRRQGIDLSESRDVIGHMTIRFPTGHFLFAFSDSFLVRRTV